MQTVKLVNQTDVAEGYSTGVAVSIPFCSGQMSRVWQRLGKIADSSAPVLLCGETGVGKNLAARTIHALSPRRLAPYVAINCSNLSPALLDSELFGYQKGAFTGAVTPKPGLFRAAHRGTLFLDEITETSLEFQAKLLRVLDTGHIRAVGALRELKAEARIIAASNRDINAEMAEGRFPKDLFYRLNVFRIHIPPLRERPADIPPLVSHFIRTYNAEPQTHIEGANNDLLERLAQFSWPGNVRELKNLIQRMMVFKKDGWLTVADLPDDYRQPTQTWEEAGTVRPDSPIKPLAHVEKEHIERALGRSNGNRAEATRLPGVKRIILIMKMKKM